MKITFLGHAGMFIETARGSILCDPWFNPAFFTSWFPFPANDHLPVERYWRPTFLYISHLHRDHLDARFLAEHVSKEVTVILPDLPIRALETELVALGFTRFLRTRRAEPAVIDGLRVMVETYVTPADGPHGDSSLAVDDGEVRVLDQNDAQPKDFESLRAFGPYDAHFVQFSGAHYYPVAYRLPDKVKAAIGRKKRREHLERALLYIKEIGARHIFPTAGPACYLDDDLFHLNDFDNEPSNMFPDQTVMLDYLRERGTSNSHLAVPGTVIELTRSGCDVRQPGSEVLSAFGRKREYLTAYRERMRDRIAADKAAWPSADIDVPTAMREWIEPLLAKAGGLRRRIDGRILLDGGAGCQVVIDAGDVRVAPWQGQYCRFRFRIDPRLLRALAATREFDWENSLFGGFRFTAERDGPYNEHVYFLLKSLSSDHIDYLESFYAQPQPGRELWECGDYLVERRCPHMHADLKRFAKVEDGILTCTMHGWEFELATGRCLTSDDRELYRVRLHGSDARMTRSEREDGSAAH